MNNYSFLKNMKLITRIFKLFFNSHFKFTVKKSVNAVIILPFFECYSASFFLCNVMITTNIKTL